MSRAPELDGTIDGRVDELGQPVRFPVPQDDCAAVLDDVRSNAARFGIDPARIAVGGASAGASLAASATLRSARAGRAPGRRFSSTRSCTLSCRPLTTSSPTPSPRLRPRSRFRGGCTTPSSARPSET
ncbi:alpha/beta hydrolase fold domain-containing protein [Homoserinibacter gongjuensis]|uniref:alpha/beta hydrolase fold domain-containing protein n=1 Tax=Homoserinibacter gongjuensis TaxID=1162968 RepID=UPI003D66D5AF